MCIRDRLDRMTVPKGAITVLTDQAVLDHDDGNYEKEIKTLIQKLELKGVSVHHLVQENVGDLSNIIKTYPNLAKTPLVVVSKQGAVLDTLQLVTGGKEAIVLQVHKNAESLNKVPTVAIMLRLSSGQLTLPGLEKTPAGIFIFKPLLLLFNEIYEKMISGEAIGISA